MREMRVHELAKIAGVKSADMLAGVQELGIEIKSYMSMIGGKDLEHVCKELNIDLSVVPESEETKKKPAPKKKPAAKKAASSAAVKKTAAAKKTKETKDSKAKPEKETKPAVKKPKMSKPAAVKKAPEPKKKEEASPVKKEEPKATPAPKAEKKEKKTPAPKTVEAPVAEEKAEEQTEADRAAVDVIHVNKPIVLRDLAEKLGVKPRNIIKHLMAEGVFASINQMLDLSAVDVVAKSYGVKLEKDSEVKQPRHKAPEPEEKEVLKPRPPVVTFMGHVDHGKTTLLDYIKKTRVAQGEFGGITQHIGAYTVRTDHGTIVFMDTPGHAAFTALRARGANLTDICVLVVAADDGIMQQTVEALNHAKAAGVPVIVALNKIDKPGVNIDVVKRQLLQYDLMPEELGGETICVPVSGLTGEGIDHLIEMILLQAEIMELKGAPEKKKARAVVVESKMCKGQGPVVTAIVQAGTLKPGDAFVCDCFSGKVRTMKDHTGANVKSAGPSYPVEISGFSGVPEPGEVLETVRNEKEAKAISAQRAHERKVGIGEEEEPLTWQEQIRLAGMKELRVIVKSDVQGSLEAIVGALESLSTEQVMVKIIHKGVGDIAENDVMLASASGAGIIGFNIRFDNRIRDIAKRNKVDIRVYRIIYDLTDDIKKLVTGMIEPEAVETVQGRAEVRQLFKLSRFGNVLGCYVLDGKITRRSKIRVIRDEEVAGNARISSLKRFKEEVKEVNTGFEFGIKIEGTDNLKPEEIKVGDILEAYIIEAVPVPGTE